MPASPIREAFRNIALCTVGELFGGVERHVLTLLDELQVLGFKPTLLLFNDGELAAQARQQGIEPLILPNRNLAMLQTSREIASVLKQRQIEVIHAHGYKAMVFCA